MAAVGGVLQLPGWRTHEHICKQSAEALQACAGPLAAAKEVHMEAAGRSCRMRTTHASAARAACADCRALAGVQAALVEAVEDCGFEASVLGQAGAAALSLQACAPLSSAQMREIKDALTGRAGVSEASVEQASGRIKARPQAACWLPPAQARPQT